MFPIITRCAKNDIVSRSCFSVCDDVREFPETRYDIPVLSTAVGAFKENRDDVWLSNRWILQRSSPKFGSMLAVPLFRPSFDRNGSDY